VTRRRLVTFIDALADGRRPGKLRVGPADAELVRTAITLRAARPGDAIPDEQYVSDLFDHLAHQAQSRAVSEPRPIRMGRGRRALVAVAAAVVLVSGTVIGTETFNQAPVTSTAIQAPQGSVLRTGTFETADNQSLGQIVAYRGHPSWVFMNVAIAKYNGPIVCKLQVDNGATVATGAFEINRGSGEWARTIRVDVGRLRGAKLVTSTGAIVASATFA
jgi:hypothetical protein